MKYLSCIILIICILSCDKLVKRKISTQDILREELETFNWNDVDVYPSFANCDEAISKLAKKDCFQTTMSQLITETIFNEFIVVSKTFNETVYIDFLVSDKGVPKVLTIEATDLLYSEIPELNSIIYKALDALPPIFPASKRGQQVKTQFRLPITIQVQ